MTITSISPVSIVNDGVVKPVQIVGGGFAALDQVYVGFDGNLASFVEVISDTLLVVLAPAAPSGTSLPATIDVVVSANEDLSGGATLAGGFTWLDTDSYSGAAGTVKITSINPPSCDVDYAYNFYLAGTGFSSTATITIQYRSYWSAPGTIFEGVATVVAPGVLGILYGDIANDGAGSLAVLGGPFDVRYTDSDGATSDWVIMGFMLLNTLSGPYP